MFRLFDRTNGAAVCVQAGEAGCVALAVEDLCNDVRRVSGLTLSTCSTPCAQGTQLIIGTLTNPAIRQWVQEHHVDVSPLEGQWEHYLMETLSETTMVILGSDERGTMWGIYEFCARFLGVDPLYWWTENEPRKLDKLDIPHLRIWDGPKGFRFRGWFINDEDLLSALSAQAGSYGPVLARIIEAALRLKQNLLIPCSFLNIFDPAEEAIIRQVTERGLFISMHHQEPVGISQQTVEDYCRTKGMPQVNYVDNPEVYEQLWKQSIQKWAKYKHVIWQLGLRGRGDRPVWYGCSQIPQTDAERGALISKAIARQLELVHEACGDAPVYSSTTLWMEGMPLYQAGALELPGETIIVMSDFGPDQTWPDGYEALPRFPGHSYGIYNHLAFWGCGPHLVQGNSPEKIRWNFQRAVCCGDTAYSITNVANVREFVCGIAYMASLTWNPTRDDPTAFMQRWCMAEYGGEEAAACSALYAQYFNAFAQMDTSLFPRRMVLMDGMCRRVAMQLMNIIRGQELTQPDIQNKRLFDFPTTDAFIAWYRKATEDGMERFAAVYRRAVSLREEMPVERRCFFSDQLVMQSGVMEQLYTWVWALCGAAANRRSGGDEQAFLQCVAQAETAMKSAMQIRKSAAHGPWKNWYAQDKLSDFADALCKTAALKDMGNNAKT